MIIDKPDNAEKYARMNPHFAKAFAFLKSARPKEGRQEVDENIIAIVFTEKDQPKPLEAHKRNIDIHYILKGTATMGWKPLKDCKPSEYNEKDDCTLFPDKPDAAMTLPTGTFAIFFPEDAHCSMNKEEVTKMVLKVRIE